ncbi:hypothetical protein Tco_0790149 [Tanacetum coccineum]
MKRCESIDVSVHGTDMSLQFVTAKSGGYAFPAGPIIPVVIISGEFDQLSTYGDMKSARQVMLVELIELVKANPSIYPRYNEEDTDDEENMDDEEDKDDEEETMMRKRSRSRT